MGGDITVNSTDAISNDSLLVNITIDENAALGTRDIIVNNDFVPDTLDAGFAVTPTLSHYVSPNGSSTYPYARPEDAAPSLAAVLAAAGTGDSVFVDTMTIANATANITVGIAVSGGWMDNFTNRDLTLKRTTLLLTNNAFAGATLDPIVFDGFRLKDGEGTQDVVPFNGFFGGGMRIVNGNVTVSNCVFESCVAAKNENYGGGGALFAFNSTVTIANNTFTSNQATQGGAIYLYDCDGTVSSNLVLSNAVGVGGSKPPTGAGIALQNCANITFSGNTLDGNTGAQNGGGYAIDNSTGVWITADVVSDNTASFAGGGAYLRNSEVTFTGVRFESNASSLIGGSLAADSSLTTSSECQFVGNTAVIGAGPYASVGEAYFRHNIMSGNVASTTGGGLYLNDITAGEVIGNTIDGNAGTLGIGGLFVVGSPIEVFNNIVTNSFGHGFGCSGAAPTNTHNLVWNSSGNDYEGCSAGAGAVTGDALYADVLNEDYRLTLNSPAIDSGRSVVTYDDPDGSPGDMGAYGSHAFSMAQPSYPKNLTASFTSGEVVLSWARNPESDIDYYAIYCDSVSGFVPSADNLVTTTPDSTLNLGAPADTAYYRVSAVDTNGYASGYALEAGSEPPITTGIGETARYKTLLGQNVPNPFNPSTTIRFSLAVAQPVHLVVFDVAGRRVRTLLHESRTAGMHVAVWDGKTDNGNQAASGIYFYRLEAGTFSQTRKMLLLK